MIITCECGFQDEKNVQFNLTYPRKDIEVNWECEACGRFHVIKIELIKIVE